MQLVIYLVFILVVRMLKGLSKILLIIVLLMFMSSYIVSTSDYYEYTKRNKNVISGDRIKEFEEDIKNNIEIDMKDYMDNKEEDYSNKITDFVYNISDNSNKIAKKTIRYLFKKISVFVE